MVHEYEGTGKFSEKFFVKRIQELQKKIRESLPSVDSVEKDAFIDACKVVQACIRARDQAQSLLDSLHKAKADKDLIDKANAAVETCESAEVSAEDTMAITGKGILQSIDVRSSIDEACLLECTVLVQGTPKGLAEWVARDRTTNEKLLASFLGSTDWMKQMIIGGGASNGFYGPAIALHSQLMKLIMSDDLPTTPMRHKIALAISLEHATPIKIFKKDKAVIDPIGRFWYYVKAYENGELDENFDMYSVWELRMVVDSNAEDEDLTWGREYLKAYRPDEIIEKDFKWKYLWAVRSDVGYRHPEHEFYNYKQLLSAGGECGPRAFFGRFICKAWGTPTWGVRQPGHAALSRWTPSGWKVCLGAAFKWSWWDDERYGHKTRKGPDFLEETKARAACCPLAYYSRMGTLECLAECMGETIVEHVDPDKMWRSLSLAQRRFLAESPSSGPRQTDHSALKAASGDRNVESADELWTLVEETIVEHPSNTILVPATAFYEPSNPNKKKVMTMSSFLGGSQLHLESDGSVSYEMPQCVTSGYYLLTARIVTVHQNQVPLTVSIDDCDEGDERIPTNRVQVDIPYSGGEWQITDPVKVKIGPGSVFKIGRDADCHGLTIKDFSLVAED